MIFGHGAVKLASSVWVHVGGGGGGGGVVREFRLEGREGSAREEAWSARDSVAQKKWNGMGGEEGVLRSGDEGAGRTLRPP